MRSAAGDVPFLSFGNPADAGPAVLFNGGEVLDAVEVGGDVLALLMGSLLTDGVGLVDVVDASHFQVVGTVVAGHEAGQEHKSQDYQLHRSKIYYIVTVTSTN